MGAGLLVFTNYQTSAFFALKKGAEIGGIE